MNNQDIIYGRNNVFEALKKRVQIDKLYIQSGASGEVINNILVFARQAKVVIKNVNKIRLDEMCRDIEADGMTANHQGVVATVPAFAYGEIEDIFALAYRKEENPFIIILDGIKDPQNLGAIIRSAEVLGAHGIIIGKHRSAGLNSVAYKVSCGAAQYIPVVKVTNISQTIDDLKKKGVWIAAADMDGMALSKMDLTGPLAIIIGSEGEGVSHNLKQNSDMVVSIEMCGNISSLNAACAASILLYEKQRQELLKK